MEIRFSWQKFCQSAVFYSTLAVTTLGQSLECVRHYSVMKWKYLVRLEFVYFFLLIGNPFSRQSYIKSHYLLSLSISLCA